MQYMYVKRMWNRVNKHDLEIFGGFAIRIHHSDYTEILFTLLMLFVLFLCSFYVRKLQRKKQLENSWRYLVCSSFNERKLRPSNYRDCRPSSQSCPLDGKWKASKAKKQDGNWFSWFYMPQFLRHGLLDRTVRITALNHNSLTLPLQYNLLSPIEWLPPFSME